MATVSGLTETIAKTVYIYAAAFRQPVILYNVSDFPVTIIKLALEFDMTAVIVDFPGPPHVNMGAFPDTVAVCTDAQY